MYTRILVPLDGSVLAEQVLPYARAIAKGLDARVELVRAFDPIPRELTEDISSDFNLEFGGAAAGGLGVSNPTPRSQEDSMHGRYLDQIAEQRRQMVEDYLEKVKDTFALAGIEASTTIFVGPAAEAIVTEAEKESDTLIAMTTHGRSGVSRWAMGSVADKVLRATANPLLLTRAHEDGTSTPLTSIIVPLDGSEMAERVLDHASAMAKGLGVGITLVQVTPAAAQYYRYTGQEFGGYAPTEHYEDFAKTVDEHAARYLDKIHKKFEAEGVSPIEHRIMHGHDAETIVDTANETDGSIVAMATHGRSGIARWVLGSVADRVVTHAETPVLIIRATKSNG